MLQNRREWLYNFFRERSNQSTLTRHNFFPWPCIKSKKTMLKIIIRFTKSSILTLWLDFRLHFSLLFVYCYSILISCWLHNKVRWPIILSRGDVSGGAHTLMRFHHHFVKYHQQGKYIGVVWFQLSNSLIARSHRSTNTQLRKTQCESNPKARLTGGWPIGQAWPVGCWRNYLLFLAAHFFVCFCFFSVTGLKKAIFLYFWNKIKYACRIMNQVERLNER